MSLDFWWLRPSTTASFAVAARCTTEGDEAKLSIDGREATAVASPTVRDGVVDLKISGLASGGRYPFKIHVNGVEVARGVGRTYRSQMRIALGSCMSPTDATPVFDAVREWDPDLLCVMGDLYYETFAFDLYGEVTVNCMASVATSKDKALRYAQIRQAMKRPDFLRLIQQTPLFHALGDHEVWNDAVCGSDAGLLNSYVAALENSSGATLVDARQALQVACAAYQDYALSVDLRCADKGVDKLVTGTGYPNYTRMRVGPVQIFALDNYLYRSSPAEPDTPSKRMLGEQQTLWLISRIEQSSAQWRLLLCPAPFFKVGYNTDTYAPAGGPKYPGYQFDALDLFWRTKFDDNLLFTCGDQHQPAVQYVTPGSLDTAFGNQGRAGYPAVLCTCACPLARYAAPNPSTAHEFGVVHQYIGPAGYSGQVQREVVRGFEIMDVTATSVTRHLIDGHNVRWWSANMTSGSRVPVYPAASVSRNSA